MTNAHLTRTAYVALGFLALILTAIFALLAGAPDSERVEDQVANQRALPTTVGVCGPDDGVPIDLGASATHLPYRLQLPHSPAASVSSVASAVICRQTEVIATFQSGVRVYNDVSTIADPAANWSEVAAGDEAEASAGTLSDGTPALFIDPAKDPSGLARGSVTFVHDGTWVVVEGNGSMALAALTRIAATVSGS